MKKKILALVIAALMMLALVPVGVMAKTEEGTRAISSGTRIFFHPNNWWKSDNARVEMFLFGNSGDRWFTMTDPDADGFYYVDIPDGDWTGIIFCRSDPNQSEGNWGHVWNQTVNLYPEGHNCFTVSDYTVDGKYSGFWWDYESGYTVYAINNTSSWTTMNVYYHIPGENNNDNKYPGVSMQYCGNNVYKTIIPNSTNLVIFNNGNDYEKTGNITSNISNGACWTINGSGDSYEKSYLVNVDSGITNGTVTSNYFAAPAGTTVTLTAAPEAGYYLNSLEISYSVGSSTRTILPEKGNNPNEFTFTAPSYDVTVTATFTTGAVPPTCLGCFVEIRNRADVNDSYRDLRFRMRFQYNCSYRAANGNTTSGAYEITEVGYTISYVGQTSGITHTINGTTNKVYFNNDVWFEISAVMTDIPSTHYSTVFSVTPHLKYSNGTDVMTVTGGTATASVNSVQGSN